MKVAFSTRSTRQYAVLSPERKSKFDKQLGFLLANLRHPSLRAKKYDEAREIWLARVDAAYRFYFQIEDDTYWVLSIVPHPEVTGSIAHVIRPSLNQSEAFLLPRHRAVSHHSLAVERLASEDRGDLPRCPRLSRPSDKALFISFQAPEFYERHGYRVFGTIDCAPSGTSRIFMTKVLGRPPAA
jgi:mRNA-degrading endonuclease RelE of RelBE toxin-antitoxin system